MFRQFVVPSYYLKDKVETITLCVEGFQDITQTRQAGLIDQIGQNAKALLAGQCGDLFLDDMGLPDDQSLSKDDMVEHIWHKIRKRGWELIAENVCQSDLKTLMSEAVLANSW